MVGMPGFRRPRPRSAGGTAVPFVLGGSVVVPLNAALTAQRALSLPSYVSHGLARSSFLIAVMSTPSTSGATFEAVGPVS